MVKKKTTPDIKYLFEPQGAAVIGASENPEKIGFRLMENIKAGGFKGNCYPVNPKGGKILGTPVVKNLGDIKGRVDLACIAVPAAFVLPAAQECADKGVKFLAVITSGFSETGNSKDEQALVSLARKNGMRILGPNIFGLFSAKSSLNATFGPKVIRKGRVAIITQSGALGIAMIGKTAVEHVGVSSIISVGNKSDLNESDLLEYLKDDPLTKVVMMYMEGVTGGERLIKTLQAFTQKKPVVVIKSGRSKRGAIAAASHTGALAGADDIFDNIMRQCGVLRAESLQQAFDWCKFFSDMPHPGGAGDTVIITNGGGIGVMATDACEKYGVKLYDNVPKMQKIFSKSVPSFGSAKNPVDLTGQATAKDYDLALQSALKAPGIDAVMALYCETAVFDIQSLTGIIVKNFKKYIAAKKPVLFSMFGGENTERCLHELREKDAYAFTDVYEGVSCLGAMVSYTKTVSEPLEPAVPASIDKAAIRSVIEIVRRDKRNFLFSHEGRIVLEAARIQMPASRLSGNLEQAVAAAEEIGYPVVMKVVSRDILHKSDAGGVVLDLVSREEVMDAYQAIVHNCRQYKADARIDGIEVTAMAKPGVELIVGARWDRALGPIVMAGQGGIYVEVMHDVSFRALPLSPREALSMVKQIKAYPLLLGVRGEERKDIESVTDTIIKIGSILTACDDISDIEINPLVVYDAGEGMSAVDVRIMLKKGGD